MIWEMIGYDRNDRRQHDRKRQQNRKVKGMKEMADRTDGRMQQKQRQQRGQNDSKTEITISDKRMTVTEIKNDGNR